MNLNNHRSQPIAAGANNRPILQGYQVLLVEDDPGINTLLSELLPLFGAVVTAVKSADQALEALQQITPHILLSDIFLPGEDGCSLLQKIRGLEVHNQGHSREMIPAVAITGSVSPENQARLLEAGFQAYVAKPFEIKNLVKLVANLVEENQA